MSLLQFASDSPWLAFFLACLVTALLGEALSVAFRCWNRLLRHLNIRKQGWPPAHLDGDGDHVPAHRDSEGDETP